MKKSELKNIIKECVKEVIFEEGVLSGIISEVAHGLNEPLQRHKSYVQARQPSSTRGYNAFTQFECNKAESVECNWQHGYDDVKNKFANPGLFEGHSRYPRVTVADHFLESIPTTQV